MYNAVLLYAKALVAAKQNKTDTRNGRKVMAHVANMQISSKYYIGNGIAKLVSCLGEIHFTFRYAYFTKFCKIINIVVKN